MTIIKTLKKIYIYLFVYNYLFFYLFTYMISFYLFIYLFNKALMTVFHQYDQSLIWGALCTTNPHCT